MSLIRWVRANPRALSPWALAAGFLLIGAATSPGFVAPAHLTQLAVFSAFVGFAALGQTLVVISGGLDLSVPWLMAFGGIELSRLTATGWNGGVAIVVVLVAAAAVGVVNSVGVSVLHVPPIVMTLAVGGLVQSYLLAVGLLQAQGNGMPSQATWLATAKVGGVPIVVVLWVLAAIGTAVLLRASGWGRALYAIGANERAAYLAGVRAWPVRAGAYAASAVAAAAAGILVGGYTGTTYLGIGQPYLFTSIAAVIIGGASILGGTGSYVGTAGGAVALTVLNAMLPLFRLSDAELRTVFGFVIIAGVYLSGASSGPQVVVARLRARFRRSPAWASPTTSTGSHT